MRVCTVIHRGINIALSSVRVVIKRKDFVVGLILDIRKVRPVLVVINMDTPSLVYLSQKRVLVLSARVLGLLLGGGWGGSSCSSSGRVHGNGGGGGGGMRRARLSGRSILGGRSDMARLGCGSRLDSSSVLDGRRSRLDRGRRLSGRSIRGGRRRRRGLLPRRARL